MTYPEVSPRLDEIQAAVLNRRMPPWGAVKGFGDFRNDHGLSQEEIELISEWIDSGARKGNNPNLLPRTPKFSKPAKFKKPKGAVAANGPLTFDKPFVLDGLFFEQAPDKATARVVAEFPDGHLEPLLWLYEYKDTFQHPFLLRSPIELPVGTKILGIPSNSRLLFLPGKKP